MGVTMDTSVAPDLRDHTFSFTFLLLAIVCPLFTVMMLCMDWAESVPVCGFWAPGRSELWHSQLASCRSAEGRVSWPTFEGGPTVQMYPFHSAMWQLDSGDTSVPELQVGDQWSQVRFHANMVPHVRRNVPELKQAVFEQAAIIERAGALEGVARQYTAGYVNEYHGGVEQRMTLKDFLALEQKVVKGKQSEHWYWLGCFTYEDIESEVQGAKFQGQSTESRSAFNWLFESMQHLFDRPLISGIKLPATVCLRVAAASARLRMHHDSMHNFLFNLHGTRKVLLMMPDLGRATLDPVSQSGSADLQTKAAQKAIVAGVDPRAINYTHHPRVLAAHLLTASLDPGDVLFVPAMWWHYIEAEPKTTAEPHSALLSIALNIFLGVECGRELVSIKDLLRHRRRA